MIKTLKLHLSYGNWTCRKASDGELTLNLKFIKKEKINKVLTLK